MKTDRLTDSRLKSLSRQGQSVWIDWLSRDLLQASGLRRLIAGHGVTGVTTNPTILEHAISGSGAYEQQIAELTAAGLSPTRVLERISASDVQLAAAQLLPVWDAGGGSDGYVSWEVEPSLAWNATRTVVEVERLADRVGFPNLLIKIPATEVGLRAIEDSIATGHSINVTLIFSVERYAAVAEAYLRGLSRAAEAGHDLRRIHSVASLFISRLDTAADEQLGEHGSLLALALRGRLGIATAKLAYRHFRDVFNGPRWEGLRADGATPQRLLWASTSMKNSAYRDVRYVEELIGPQTVTTLPQVTLEAFEDHGRIAPTLERNVDAAARVMSDFADAGVDVERLTDELERDGIAQFTRSFDAAVKRIRVSSQTSLAA
jgi:transaldolase